MFLKLILYLSLVILCGALQRCLTGYMTDIQTWVGVDGELTLNKDRESTLNLFKCASDNIMLTMIFEMRSFKIRNGKRVNVLSLAKNDLKQVPNVFRLTDIEGYTLAQTLEYITLCKNKFSDFALPTKSKKTAAALVPIGAAIFTVSDWAYGFNGIVFEKLLELDLRDCGINTIHNNTFMGMPSLKKLYIGENMISFIDANAFAGMKNLVHLDISRNNAFDDQNIYSEISFGSAYVFKAPGNLESLDLSFTTINPTQVNVLRGLGRCMHTMSICKTELSGLDDYFFNGTSLQFLDISWNLNILKHVNVFSGLEDSLKVIYADKTGLQDLEPFKNMRRLEILKVANNFISVVNPQNLENLTNLQILDLKNNQLSTWFGHTFSQIKNLKYLSLKTNDFKIISRAMIEDIAHVTYLGFSDNKVKCDCYSRNLLEIAAENEKKRLFKLLEEQTNRKKIISNQTEYHIGYRGYNDDISRRKIVTLDCDQDNCDEYNNINEVHGNFTFIDYDVEEYKCFLPNEGIFLPYDNQISCLSRKNIAQNNYWNTGKKSIVLMIVSPTCLLICLLLTIYFKNNMRYFYVSLRNSIVLSGLEKNSLISGDNKIIFNYDLFVSYCNEDREWVLENLIPHLETDCNIRVCLHERDFQVGVSILDNIVSCMDRSRSIMLIVTQRFLLSQWCQFEMHLAQHRLLETRREDLILLLLEEIPRHLRPNTLHYLMLTKTYIQLPKLESEHPAFWKRIKKTVVTLKNKSENSVA